MRTFDDNFKKVIMGRVAIIHQHGFMISISKTFSKSDDEEEGLIEEEM